MPQLGESVVEGTIGRWLKQPGEAIRRHEPLLEVTTDKVDTEVPSEIDGTVLELLIAEGETVRVGTVIARLMEQAEQAAVAMTPVVANVAEATQAPPISPVVARLASEHGIDLKQIAGTGGNGRITKKDVERFMATQGGAANGTPKAAPAPAVRATMEPSGGQATAPTQDVQAAMNASTPVVAEQSSEPGPHVAQGAYDRDAERPVELGPGDELVPLSPMRRAIAEHMARSKRTAPHVTTVMEADLSRVAAQRDRLKTEYERQGVRLTYTAYFVEATVAALRALPIVNASFRDNGVEMHDHINIGVAVAIADGLIVPVIKDADERSLLGLARAVNDLSERARLRRLQPDDVEGGTFTITNHGVGGSIFATPIINQPQAAILGIGAIEKRPVVVSEGGLDALAIRLRCYLSLTFDHRLIDGATADEFLRTVKQRLETYAG
jgi:2-oxoglutarate dehydrogenase E2 component (dihydrolipoamide succinyltransferase)